MRDGELSDFPAIPRRRARKIVSARRGISQSSFPLLALVRFLSYCRISLGDDIRRYDVGLYSKEFTFARLECFLLSTGAAFPLCRNFLSIFIVRDIASQKLALPAAIIERNVPFHVPVNGIRDPRDVRDNFHSVTYRHTSLTYLHISNNVFARIRVTTDLYPRL